MATWVVQIDYGDGWIDITDKVLLATLRRKRSLWTSLIPNTNSISFEMVRDVSIINELLSMPLISDVKVQITKDSAAWFSGFMRTNVKITIKNQILPLKIECVDSTIKKLNRKIQSNSTWLNYKVCDHDNTSTSIVHALLTLAGYSSGEINISETIDKTIDYFVIHAKDDSYFELLKSVLFEHGYTFYHDNQNRFNIFKWNQDTISTAKYFSNTAVAHNISEGIEIEPKGFEFGGVDIEWWTHEQATELTPVFVETAGATSSHPDCYVEMSEDGYYPNNADSQDVYVDYQSYKNVTKQSIVTKTQLKRRRGRGQGYAAERVQELQSFQSYEASGQELICVPDTVTFEIAGTDIALETSVNEYVRAKIKIHNTDTVNHNFMTKFSIKGYPILRGDTNRVSRLYESGDQDKIFELKSAYLVTESEATTLACGLERYFRFSPMAYRLRSVEDWAPGDYVYIDEDLNLGTFQLCVITDVNDSAITEEKEYILEGVAEYVSETVSVQSNHHAPTPVPKAAVSNIQFTFESPSGNGTIDNPVEGDRLYSKIGTVDQYYEYTGGQWVNQNSLLIGLMVSGLFLAMIGCGGIFNPNDPPTSTEYLPNPNFRVFNFENNYQDQNGLDDWAKSYVSTSTTQKKFGSYSLRDNGSDLSSNVPPWAEIDTPSALFTIGVSQAYAAWYRFDTINLAGDFTIGELYWDGNNYIYLNYNYDTNKISVLVRKGGGSVQELTYDVAMATNTWYYIGFVYNADTDVIYLIVNNAINSLELSDSWGAASAALMRIKVCLWSTGSVLRYRSYVDEVLWYQNKLLPPELLAQHYTHNVPWDTEYSKADSLWMADSNNDGRCVVRDNFLAKGTATITGLLSPLAGIAPIKTLTTAALSANTIINTAHGMGAVPNLVYITAVCATAEQNYSIGDEIPISNNNDEAGSTSYRIAFNFDATNCNVITNTSFVILNKTTRTAVAATIGYWKIRYRIYG